MNTTDANHNAETIKANLAIIDEVGASLSALDAHYSDLPVIDVMTPEGYAEAKQRKKPLTKARTRTETARKNAGRVYLDEKRRIDEEARRIFDGVAKHEQPLIDEIARADRAEDERVQAILRDKQVRLAAIDERIAAIRLLRTEAATLEQIDAALAHLADETPETADERAEQMHDLIEASTAALTARRADLVEHQEQQRAQAEQAARLEQQRIDQAAAQAKIDQQQADADAREKKLRDDEAAAAKAKADEEARVEKEAANEAARIEAEAAAEQKRIEAEKAAEEQRIADEKQAKVDAAAAKKRARDLAKASAAERHAQANDLVALEAWVAAIAPVPECGSSAGRQIAATVTAFVSDLRASVDELRGDEERAA